MQHKGGLGIASKLAVLLLAMLALPSLHAANGGLSSWTSTTVYPGTWTALSCGYYNGYVYCVGGASGTDHSARTYYASLSSSGIGSWTSSTAYTLGIDYHSCATYSGYIYCVRGESQNPPDTGTIGNTASVYSAPISGSGIGSWTSTTSYPNADRFINCNIYNGYIYCLGGESYGGTAYFASVSGGSVGSWTSFTVPPSFGSSTNTQPQCAIYNGYIYCVGGPTTATTEVDYATVSGSGVGAWTATTSFPVSVDRAVGEDICKASNGYLYCMIDSGTTYFASISSSGVGGWNTTSSVTSTQSCGIYNGRVYCVNGGNTNTYYAYINPTVTISPPSNTIADQNQYESFNGVISGGTAPYNVFLYVANSVTKSTVPYTTNAYFSGTTWSFNGIQIPANWVTNSPLVANVILTDANPVTVNTVYTSTFTINPVLASSGWTVSNSIIVQKSSQILTATVSGGSSSYTYNFLVYNSIGSLVNNALYTTSSTSNTFVYTQNSVWGTGTFTANIIIKDSASTPVSVTNSITYTAVSQPTLPNAVSNYLPIILTNSQSSATSSNTQIMIPVNSSTYKSYEAGNLMNTEFFYANGTIITSWLEGNNLNEGQTTNLNTVANTLYWLKIAPQISANGGTLTVYMGFASNTVDLFDGSKVGVAPLLYCASGCPTTSYGGLDNGANIFDTYDNFAGTSLNARWSTLTTYATISVSNGVTVTACCGGGGGGIYINTNIGVNEIAEINGTAEVVIYAQSGLAGDGVDFGPTGGRSTIGAQLSGGHQGEGSSTGYNNPPKVGGIGSPGGSTAFVVGNYVASTFTDATNIPSFSSVYPAVGYHNFNTGTFTAQWFRERKYPPSGVMPSAAFGAVVSSVALAILPISAAYGSTVTLTASCTGSSDSCAVEYPIGTIIANALSSSSYTICPSPANTVNCWAVGTYSISANDLTSGLGTTGTLTINQAAPLITLPSFPSPNSITYNGVAQSITANIVTVGNQLQANVFNNGGSPFNSFYTQNLFTLSSVGTYAIVANTLGNGNYLSNSTSNTLVISKATPSLTLPNFPANFVYNGLAVTLTANIVTFGNQLTANDYLNNVLINSFTTQNQVPELAAGTYVFVANTLGNGNYLSASISNTLLIALTSSGLSSNNIIPKPLSVILYPSHASIYAGQTITFTNTTSGGTPPLTFGYTVNRGFGYIQGGNKFIFINSGSYNITFYVIDSGGQRVTSSSLVNVTYATPSVIANITNAIAKTTNGLSLSNSSIIVKQLNVSAVNVTLTVQNVTFAINGLVTKSITLGMLPESTVLSITNLSKGIVSFQVTNVTMSTPNATAGHNKLLAMKVIVTGNPTTNVTYSYNCSIVPVAGAPVPYELVNNAWKIISSTKTSQNRCAVSFSKPSDSNTFALFANVVTKPTATTIPTAISAVLAQTGNALIVGGATVIIAIGIILYYLWRRWRIF